MAKESRFCSRCGELLKKHAETCPNCGAPILRAKKQSETQELERLKAERMARIESRVSIDPSTMSAAKREQLEKEEAKRRQIELEQLQNEDAEKNATSRSKEKRVAHSRNKEKKKKQKKLHKHKKPELFDVSTDQEGKVAVDVRDVSFLPQEKPQIKKKKNYKLPEKLKWYDIAKWADRMLARRKVKKVVNKAATEMPPEISKGTMVSLAIFFGWMGAHNFYAKNWVRGAIVCASFVIAATIVSTKALANYWGEFFAGLFGLIAVICWFWDIFRILFNRYRFRTSRKKFVDTLNFDTRAILGRRYIKKEIAEMEENEQ